jgi:hypothetical protein
MMDGSERLKTNSRRLRRVFLVLLVLTPIFNALFWIGVGEGEITCLKQLPVKIVGTLPIANLAGGFAASMVTTIIVMYVLYQIVRLFGFYAQGKVFDRENVACFRFIGWSIIVWEIADFLLDIALGPILTYHLGEGKRTLVIGVDNQDFYVLLAGFSVLTIAWVMDEARKIKEEQELFV